jgi:2-methylcitrate dehydratase PrpD
MSGQHRSSRARLSITAQLTELCLRPVADADRARAALHVLDWAGCAVSGSASEAGRTLARWAAQQPAGPCRTLGAGRRDLWTAAIVNGGVGNVLEMDDIHRTAILHPGPVVVPAALALAEREGATATACALLALPSRRWLDAFGNAGTQAAGLWQVRHEPVMSKQLHNGRAAHGGLLAADLARAGFTGPASILEGPQGFFAAMCPGADPHAVVREPASRWKIHDTSFKPWPACRHAHAAIDAALALRTKIDRSPVRRIAVRTYRDALAFCDRPEPRTPLDAKFSLQHSVAVALADGPPPLAAFEPVAIARPDVAALRALVEVAEAEPYAAAYPAHYGAEVEIELADGARHVARVPDALGDPENPLDGAGIRAKALASMGAGGLDAERAGKLAAACLALATGGKVSDLVQALP